MRLKRRFLFIMELNGYLRPAGMEDEEQDSPLAEVHDDEMDEGVESFPRKRAEQNEVGRGIREPAVRLLVPDSRFFVSTAAWNEERLEDGVIGGDDGEVRRCGCRSFGQTD